MHQTANDLIVKASLPGFKPEEVDVFITGDTLTIKGEHKEENEVKDENCFYKERRYGAISRSVPVPVKIKSEKTEAVFESGVLTRPYPRLRRSSQNKSRSRQSKLLRAKKHSPKAKMPITELYSLIPKSQGVAEVFEL